MNRVVIEESNLSVSRIEEKCLNCGLCLKTCLDNNGMEKDCVNCGLCILTCPTGALVPKYCYKTVLNYIYDTNYTVVIMTSPAVRVAIGDEFGFEPGTYLEGKMIKALRKIGFDYVFDTTFGADLTTMEEAKELLNRINKVENLPMFTSCCPSWVEYMNKYHFSDIKLLSTCKSPISMQGSMIKSYFSDYSRIPKENIISVALTPCVSKKTEIAEYNDVDYVITLRELAMMIRELNIDFKSLQDDEFDKLLGKGSGAGVIFGTSGGVMESTLRTSYFLLNNEKAPTNFYNLVEVRGEKDFKEATIDMKKLTLKVAVVNKLSTVKKVYETLKEYDFVEVMTCPGGCIGGAGLTLVNVQDQKEYRDKRICSLYKEDNQINNKESYNNPEIIEAYETYINKNKVELHKKTNNTFTNDK
ncbi:MAG: [Fe-Fe] hydrogenase large subunit C-terminal domain-containing protein [Bacilli bacterium]